MDDVRDKYIEIAQDISLWESSSMEVDYNDRMKKEFVLHMGGNDYLIRAAECYLRFPSVKMGSHVKDIDAVSVPGFDSGHGQLKYLWGFVVSYQGEMEKPESYFGYLKDKWTAAKEYSSSLAPEEEDIAAASEEDDTEAAGDTDDAAENAPEDTGILGRWYPDYSDFGDYFIQFNEGGTGIIMRNGEAIPITYTYSGNMIYVSVPSTGGTNEFSYERGYLYSDFDGDRYTRRNGK